jgi:hypothetical protein
MIGAKKLKKASLLERLFYGKNSVFPFKTGFLVRFSTPEGGPKELFGNM